VRFREYGTGAAAGGCFNYKHIAQNFKMLTNTGVAVHLKTSHYDKIQEKVGPPLTTTELRVDTRYRWICETIWMVVLGAFSFAIAAVNIKSGMTWVSPLFFVLGGLFFVWVGWAVYSLCTNREKKIYPGDPMRK
jgi:hypothetical protein